MTAAATARLLTVKQVLAVAGISRNTLYNWERAGKIPRAHRNVSGHRVYTEEQAEQIQRHAHTLYPPLSEATRPGPERGGKK